MKLGVVLWHDRHRDPEIYLFTSVDKAIDYAKQEVQSNRRDYMEPEEETSDDPDDRYFARWTSEDDYVRVMEVEVEND